MPRILVIGYGNELRGDDALGPHVARQIAARDLPDVLALAVPQLVPELAELVAAAEQVIFVDAVVASKRSTVKARPIGPAKKRTALGHASRPAELLALAQAVFGCCPPASLVTIPGSSFELGEGISTAANRHVTEALGLIVLLIAAA